jgi:2,5-diamino-6-(ribosylamino)-4(3H)-pyrimidinone 5'-phosphate reductase
MKAHRKDLGKPEHLINVLVSASASVDPTSRFFSAEHASARIVATVEDAPPDKVAALARVAEVWPLGRGRVDLEQVLERLAARGVARLLVEGGGELNWSFFAKDLVDEIYVTVAPAILGGREAPTLCEGEGFAMDARRKLYLISTEVVDGEIYCRYAVVR